ncbi:MAG: FecR family protein [Spirochaetota bacterium]
MKKIVILIIVSLSFGISCIKKPQHNILVIHSFFGNVSIQSNNSTQQPTVGYSLSPNDVIITDKGSIVDLLYRDSGIIRINENTKVTVSSLIKGGTDDVILTIDTGKTFAVLGKLKKGENFALKSKTVIAAVRGTSFRMVATKEGASVNVVTGKVKVQPVSNNSVVEDVEVIVDENQTVALDTKTVETIVQKIEEKKSTAAEQDVQQKMVEEIKETIKPIETPKETIKEIKQEVKNIPVLATVHEEVKQEISKVVSDTSEAEKREEEEILKKEKEKADKEMQVKVEKEREAKIMVQKLEEEKRAKEKAEREKAAKEQKIKEDRVKNIPTL